MARYLGGSDVGFEIPGLGVFNGRNITPDKETGIGSWTDEQIAAAITTGKRPDGRQLAPIMNYASFTYMTKEDVAAVVAYLRSVPPVHNEVPGPFKPGEKVSIFTLPRFAAGRNRNAGAEIAVMRAQRAGADRCGSRRPSSFQQAALPHW